MSETWFYFGCVREAGHYLFDRNGNKADGYGPQEQRRLRKTLSHFDGVLPPSEGDGRYRASFSTLGGLGYCALSWWDGSVDTRPGSNSTVFAPGLNWTPERLLEIYPKAFPWLAERQPKPVTLWAAQPPIAPSPDVARLVEGVQQVHSDLQMLALAVEKNDPKAEIVIRVSDALGVIQDRIAPLLAPFLEGKV